MRDIVLEETIYMDFTTRAFATGVPTVLAGTPVLSVLEENNATPITSGVSVSVDRASVVGLNMATIVATGANGYETGKGYSVYISTGTVGGVSVVGEKVGEFTIGASAAAQDLANGTDGLGAIKADTAEIGVAGAGLTDLGGMSTAMKAEVNTECDTAISDAALATAASLATVDGIVDNILLDTAEIGVAGAGLTDLGGMSTAMKAEVNAEADTAITDAALATAAALATVDGIVDNILLDTAEIGAAGAGLTDLGGMSTAMKAEVNAEADTAITDAALATAASLATVDGIVDNILLDTAEIGTAGAGLTDLGAMSTAMKAEILVEVNAALDTAISELSVATPSATPTTRTALMLMYMALRNKLVVQTSGTDALEVYNDAGTMIASKLITDDGSDYTEAEMT